MSQLIEFQIPIDDLPKICVHNPEKDFYSEFYEADHLCSCGNNKWYHSSMEIICQNKQMKLPPKRIQRCSSCHEIRMSTLKKKHEKIITTSNKLLETLRKTCSDDEELFSVLGNMFAKLGVSLHGESIFQNILTNMKEANQ